MNINLKPLLLGIILATFGCQITARAAQTPAINVIPDSDFKTYGGTVGFSFILTSDETVDALGILDTDSATTPGSGSVGLYDTSTGVLLTSASVTLLNTGADKYNFDYTVITPIKLTAGTEYAIGSFSTESYENDSTPDFTESTPVTVVDSVYSNGSGFNDPSSGDHGASPGADGSGIYIGPNFKYAATPEPGTYALMGLGLALLVVTLRRRSSRA